MEEDDRLKKIKESLDEVYDWPSVYVFKFILPTVPNKEEELLSCFSEEVDVAVKRSKNAKYTSFTLKEVILTSDEVIERYSKASKIEGIFSL